MSPSPGIRSAAVCRPGPVRRDPDSSVSREAATSSRGRADGNRGGSRRASAFRAQLSRVRQWTLLLLAKTGEWQGLDGIPAFLFRRGSARFAMSRVSRLSPRSREHFRAGATGRDALRGTRKPSACRLSVGQGPSPFVVLRCGSGYGPVPAGRWALTPRARRNSAATSRVAASAPSGNT